MAPFESLEAAAEALAAANSDAAPAVEETPAASVEAPEGAERASESVAETTAPQVEAEGATVEDSFTKVDLASLTEGLDPEVASRVEEAYKSFQSDYTRKTQEIAPLRKMAEEFGSVDDLRQSVEFVQNLRTDPDFAVRVHEELSAALEDAGLTEAQASAEATRQMEEAAETDPFTDAEFDPEDPRDAALQELLEFRDEFVEREQERALEAEIQRMEMAIRQQNPNYSDDDMDEIVKLSFAYGGDLLRAEQDYSALRERWLQSYVDSKEAVETQTPVSPTPTHHAQQPEAFESLDDAHAAARRHLAALLAN